MPLTCHKTLCLINHYNYVSIWILAYLLVPAAETNTRRPNKSNHDHASSSFRPPVSPQGLSLHLLNETNGKSNRLHIRHHLVGFRP